MQTNVNTMHLPKNVTTGSSDVGLNIRHMKNVLSMMIPYAITNRWSQNVIFFVIISYTSNFRFSSLTYWREIITFSSFVSVASNRPDTDGRTYLILSAFKIMDLLHRKCHIHYSDSNILLPFVMSQWCDKLAAANRAKQVIIKKILAFRTFLSRK